MATLTDYLNLPKDEQIHLQSIIDEIKQLDQNKINILKVFIDEHFHKSIPEECNVGSVISIYIKKLLPLLPANSEYRIKLISASKNISKLSQMKFMEYLTKNMVSQIFPKILAHDYVLVKKLTNLETFEDAFQICKDVLSGKYQIYKDTNNTKTQKDCLSVVNSIYGFASTVNSNGYYPSNVKDLFTPTINTFFKNIEEDKSYINICAIICLDSLDELVVL